MWVDEAFALREEQICLHKALVIRMWSRFVCLKMAWYCICSAFFFPPSHFRCLRNMRNLTVTPTGMVDPPVAEWGVCLVDWVSLCGPLLPWVWCVDAVHQHWPGQGPGAGRTGQQPSHWGEMCLLSLIHIPEDGDPIKMKHVCCPLSTPETTVIALRWDVSPAPVHNLDNFHPKEVRCVSSSLFTA